MNWLDCLCLSVPPSIALVVVAHRGAKSLHFTVIAHARNVNDALSMFASRMHDAMDRATDTLAAAHVRAARYTAGAIKVNPKPEPAETKSVFARWMDAEGKHRPAEVQDAMEFAFGFVSGEDSGAEAGDAGTAEGAKAIIERYADPTWYTAAVEDAKARR
jgi:hypothetical protein